MSSVEPLSAGSEISNYRLVERVGATVWRAQDSATGKNVALKVLTRQLPRDPARREQFIREVRLGAALYHPFLVSVTNVIAAGDTLALLMEWIDGQRLTTSLSGKPLSGPAFYDLAYQLADVVKLLQARSMVHGNINCDSVLLASTGQVKLGGLNGVNLIARREGSSSPAYQQKGSDPRSVAYMAPEQIAGQPVDAKADVFSIGVVLYEMATGALPWSGTEAGDIARAIVEGQPRSPRVVNPNIDPNVMALIGRCMFKDPIRRLSDARVLVDDIASASPDSARRANDIAARERSATPQPSKSEARGSILMLADLADYDELGAADPGAATRAAARLQQLAGEAAYLFDGQILDPFGPRVVAEMPAADKALEAGRKAEFDFSPDQQEGEVLSVRLLLHAGEVTTEGGRVSGEGVARGFAALAHVRPGQLFISEEFARHARGLVRLRDVGGRGGLKLYEIVPPEPPPQEATAEDEAAAVPAAEMPPPPPMRSRRRQTTVAAGLGLLLLGVGIGGIALSRHERATATSVHPVQHAPSGPRSVAVVQFSVEGAEPDLLERANAIRLASIEVLRTVPGIRVADGPANALAVTARLRNAPSGPEIVATTTAPNESGAATPLPDTAAGVEAVMKLVFERTRLQPHLPAPAAMNAFGDALLAKAEKDDGREESALRRSVEADPTFLPAQRMAMQFFAERGKAAEALAAARQVMALDASDVAAARLVARGSIAGADVTTALAAYAAVARATPSDAEALNTIGRYAASVGDQQRFDLALRRLQSTAAGDQAVHSPDLVAASGNVDAAIDQYYDIETRVPNNPALSLKIGRIAVLRRTISVAELELGKLQHSDPAYGYHILNAYLAAQKGSRAEAQNELKTAFAESRAGDDYWTSAAEVYAILGDSGAVIAALDKAVQRREPTSGYVLNDRLFNFLVSDAQYQKVRQTIAAEQDQVRAALARIAM